MKQPSIRGAGAALVLALLLAEGACQSVSDTTGLSKPQEAGIVGGAAGGALIASSTGAGAGWIAGAAVLGAAVGGGIASFNGEGRGEPAPTQDTLDQFATLPPGSTRTWRNPANDDHGTVKIESAFKNTDGADCKRLQETMWLAGSSPQQVDATACLNADGHWRVVDLSPVAPN